MKVRHGLGVLFVSASLLFLSSCGDDGGDGGGEAFCGNSQRESGESCDDGNNFGGDGCASNCTAENDRVFVPGPGSQAFAQTQSFGVPIAITGQFVWTTGQARDEDVLDANGNRVTLAGVIPVALPATEIDFDPISVPGLFCFCVRGAENAAAFGPGNAGRAFIGCGDTGLAPFSVSYEFTQTHGTGQTPEACMASNGFVEPPNAPHPGSCNLFQSTNSGESPRGSETGQVMISLGTIPDGGTCSTDTTDPDKGPDGVPCTDDDRVPLATPTLTLTTGVAAARIVNANARPGMNIEAGRQCGTVPCRTSLTGAPFNCDRLRANPNGGLAGGVLASAAAALDGPTGDVVTSFTFVAQ